MPTGIPLIRGSDYSVYVSALSNFDKSDNPSLPFTQILIEPHVALSYHSSDPTVTRSVVAYRRSFSFQFPLSEVAPTSDGLEPPSARAAISRMILDMNLPFRLDRLTWIGLGPEGKKETFLENEDAFVGNILKSIGRLVTVPSSKDRMLLPMIVTIKKAVILPQPEFEAVEASRLNQDRKRRLIGIVRQMVLQSGFSDRDMDGLTTGIEEAVRSSAPERERLDEDYERNLVSSLISLASRLLAELNSPRSVPATQSSVEALIKAIKSDGDSAEECSICMGEIAVGSEFTRMPCSHDFHGHCIGEWLKRSHTCPMCRFELPTA